ncbi:hypothetical protein OAH77_04495 [Flavobacteriaceae bacterium]|nr:hypothetical protein [Flavobacteriaceae bacterium]
MYTDAHKMDVIININNMREKLNQSPLDVESTLKYGYNYLHDLQNTMIDDYNKIVKGEGLYPVIDRAQSKHEFLKYSQKSKGVLVVRLVEHEAKDLSDEELSRCFKSCACPGGCVRMAKLLISNDEIKLSDIK